MAFALANSVSASALSRLPSPRDVAHPQSNVAQFEGFPVTAQSNSRRRRSPLLGPTNGDLMKRGLQPASRPRKLYQARTLAVRQAEVVPAGAQASGAPPSSTSYQSLGCSNGLFDTEYSNSHTLTFTDIQDFVDQCAGQQDIDTASNSPGTSQDFAIYNTGVNNDGINEGNCVTAVMTFGYPQTACDPDSVGYYTPA